MLRCHALVSALAGLSCSFIGFFSITPFPFSFLAHGRAYAAVLRLSVCRLSVCDVMYCG